MSFIDNLKDIENKICEEIQRKINKLRKGYEIIHYEINENNFHACSQVICLNGFNGTIWDIEKILYREYSEFIKNIENNGVIINNICYYIDTKKLYLEDLKPNDITITLINKIK